MTEHGIAPMAKIYRFKIAFKHDKKIWRRIEIKETQTLGDLDKTIRQAFKHLQWDHLSEFYQGKVWHSKGLGEINPYENSPGGRRRIKTLRLSEGDTMEHVYDFGDDIQHTVKLEKITQEDKTTRYPAIVSQNKPRYQHCEICEKQGKQTIATWICVECSNDEQRDVLLCDDCITKGHEDHYAIETVY